MLAVAAAMAYNGEFQAGYQDIDGISLGYLQINGTRMFALTQVFSDLFKDIPRATVSKRMARLQIQSRRCDLKELRTLKAIQSVPMRAVKCSLISKADLEALRTSCQALAAPRKRRRRRRKRKSKSRSRSQRREPGELFPRAALLPGGYGGPGFGARRRGAAFAGGCYQGAASPAKAYGRSGPGQLLAGVLSAYPAAGGLQRLHSAVRAHGAGQTTTTTTTMPAKQPDAGRPKRSSCGCLAPKARPGASLASGSKRHGTSAGSSSDSDSSAATSSDSSEDDEDEEDDDEDDDEEEEDSSGSSEEGSSSGSESSSLCSSGDSVQSTRYRQAALPRLPPPASSAASPAALLLPGVPKALRPDPDLLFWARTLRASAAWESFQPAPTDGASQEPPPRPRQPPPRQEPQHRGTGESPPGPAVQEEEEEEAGGARSSREGSPVGAAPEPALDPPLPSQEAPGGREAHFDRLIRQSKLWCYAKGFNVDGKGLRRARGSADAPSKAGRLLLGLAGGPLRSGHGSAGSAKREGPAKGRPAKSRRKTGKKGPGPPGKRSLLAGPAPAPSRPPFSLLGTFPCTPALVVGPDGDLCPASSLCVKDSGALAKTHPLWTWQLGGNAIPVPPSLKFRGYSLEDF